MWLAINRELTRRASANSGTYSTTRISTKRWGLPQNSRLTFGPYSKRR